MYAKHAVEHRQMTCDCMRCVQGLHPTAPVDRRVTVRFELPDGGRLDLAYAATLAEAAAFSAAMATHGYLVTVDRAASIGLQRLPCRSLWSEPIWKL